MDRLIVALASAGYAGFLPGAPGTFGTAVGAFVSLLLFPLPLPLYFAFLSAFLPLSAWLAGKAEVLFREKDSPRIVIDEVAGYLITTAFLPCNWATIAGGFLFFRVFDIIKPPPAGWINREMKGGWAVVLDDAVAGGYANICLRLMAAVFPGFLTPPGS